LVFGFCVFCARLLVVDSCDDGVSFEKIFFKKLIG